MKILTKMSISLVPLINNPAVAQAKLISRQDLGNIMDHLWIDHAVWTHDFIVAFFDNLSSLDAITKRLLQNQEDIGNTVAQFYGKNAGEQLTQLLKEHILIAVEVLQAAKSDDSVELKHANDKWHANDIALFLSKANPYLPQQTLLTMLKEHLQLTIQEATAYLKKQWSQEIILYDKVRAHLINMANVLTDAIAKHILEKETK